MAKSVSRTVTIQEVNVIATDLNTLQTERMTVPIYDIRPDDSRGKIKRAVEESLGFHTQGTKALVMIENFGEAKDVIMSMPLFQFCCMATVKGGADNE